MTLLRVGVGRGLVGQVHKHVAGLNVQRLTNLHKRTLMNRANPVGSKTAQGRVMNTGKLGKVAQVHVSFCKEYLQAVLNHGAILTQMVILCQYRKAMCDFSILGY